MSTLALILLALAQSSTSGAPLAAQDPEQQIEVTAPNPEQRRTCRPVRMSNSRIPSGRTCQTQAEREEQRDAEQSLAQRALDPTNQRTGQQLNTSGYGNYARDRWPRPIGGR